MRFFGYVLVASLFLAPSACDSGATAPAPVTSACTTPPTVAKADYCASCVFSPSAVPSSCTAPRIVNACCTWVAEPTTALSRATGLRRFSSTDPTPQLACLDTPEAAGASATVTLSGAVRVFSSGSDSADVKIEIFEQGEDGALGTAVGTAVTTHASDGFVREDLLARCPDGGCTFRQYSYAGVPTETRLVVRTSSGSAAARWGTLYEYDVYIRAASVTNGTASYDPTAIAAADFGVIAAAGGGFATEQDTGLFIGEVHDCSDVRLSGAVADIDAAHDGDVLYFDGEANPLPDRTRYAAGTSRLGMFGAINVATGVPVRVRAVGKAAGQTELLGATTVQAFKGALSTVKLRGRAPWQR